MYSKASLGLHLFSVAGVGQSAPSRGRMYALACLGLRVFCVAGVGQSAPPRGRMYALASLGLRVLCVADVGQSASPRGRMYALASLGLRVFCVAGVGQSAPPRGRMYPGVPWSPHLLRGRRETKYTAKGSDVRAPPRGRMYALASLGLRVFCVAGVGQSASPKVGCTPWRPLVSASFAWQGWDKVHRQGGRMYSKASLGLHLFSVAGVGQSAPPRGRMYALASLRLRVFCVAGVGQSTGWQSCRMDGFC